MAGNDEFPLEIQPIDRRLLPAIMDIERMCYPKPWSELMFRSEFDNSIGVARGAFLHENLIGYIFGWIIFEDLHINNVAVTPEYRGKGIGEKLVRTLFNEAHSRGVRFVTLEVRPSNEAARALYGKLGFKRVGIRKAYYSDTNEDAWVYHKELEDLDTKSCCK